MDQPVMAPARQQEVRQRRWPAVGPVNDVVDIAPQMRPVAAEKLAMAISDYNGTPHGRVNHGCSTSDVEWLRWARHDDAPDGRVTRQPPGNI